MSSFTMRSVGRKCFGEFLGTYLLVLLGCGAVHGAVLTGAQSGLWQVAIVWGVAIAIATYVVGDVSGAHLNPAISVALAMRRRFAWRLVPSYALSQTAGALVAAATLFLLFGPYVAAREQEKQVVRGQPGSEVTAMCYGDYFPSPGPLSSASGPYSPEDHARLNAMVPESVAVFAEALGTAVLAMVIFAVADGSNRAGPGRRWAPVFVGLTVAALISLVAPLTQACFNPARDFGPRLFAYFAGWGPIAIPGPRGLGFLTVYLVAPTLGATAGASLYDLVLRSGAGPATPLSRSTPSLQGIHVQTTRLILVGGFLGAGKTTLLAQATQRLVGQGKRVGLVTNDQAANLVDTAILQRSGAPVQEVAGGCFCCRFENLLASLDKLREQGHPDVLIGEPVGSCTDLSATVLQPIKDAYRDRFRVAPFSVLVDVRQVRTLDRLRRSLADKTPSRLPASVMYIYRKQLEEADLIVLNKADLLSPGELAELEGSLKEAFPRAPVLAMSALRGEGVDRWLDFVTQDLPAGRTIAAVDYDEYAAGEAALGWLNATVRLVAEGGADWASFCRGLMAIMQREFAARSAEIAHLKLHLSADGGSLAANLTGNQGQPLVRGTVVNSPNASLVLNARAHIEPEPLRALVQRSLEAAAGGRARFVIDGLESFAPVRPQPKHRYSRVV